VNYYWFDIETYYRTTAHLTIEQDMAYRRLLDLYYQTEKPIPLDMMRVADEIRIVPSVIESVLNEFFVRHEDGWHRSPADQARERGE